MTGTILSSARSQQRWAKEVQEHITICIRCPPSIFKVPNSIAKTKPEAYSPRQIGLGAFHHFRPDLDDMESTKLAAIKTSDGCAVLYKFKSCYGKSCIVNKMKALEPSIRSCYGKYLDLESDTLACAMAIDGLYLLENIKNADRRAPNDVWMMENQLPTIVMHALGNNDDMFSEISFFSPMLDFCFRDSPLLLTNEDGKAVRDYTSHLLDMMYRLVRHKLYPELPQKPVDLVCIEAGIEVSSMASIMDVVRVVADLSGAKFLKLIEKLPYDECSNLFGAINSSMEDIQVPSASRLHRAAKIQFEILDSGRGVGYDEETRTLYLPVMRLNSTHSEVVLRNLVAYELALGDKVVSGYVDLMCGLIGTAKDVEFLKEKGIIETDMESGEVAKMFKGIKISGEMVNALQEATQKMNEVPLQEATQKMNEVDLQEATQIMNEVALQEATQKMNEVDLQEATQKMNEVALQEATQKMNEVALQEATQKMNEVYDRTFKVRCFRFVKNHLIPSEKTMKLVLGILLVLLLTLQAFCQVYGCSAHWFGNITSFASI